MPDYAPPLREIRFVLDQVVGLEELSKLNGFQHADPDTTMGVVEEFSRMMVELFLPLNRVGDVQHSKMVGDEVHTPDGFKEAYRQYAEAGWGSVPFPEAYGGGGFPWVVGIAMQEVLNGCNTAFALCPLLTQGAIDMLMAHASEELQQTYLPKMVAGEWTGTMNLTEPDAGSDVGALRTKAVPNDDGTWRITGTKIFITYGEHDMVGNIVHLVLARTPGAPAGTKGISCFVVPKHLLDDDGAPGERNRVKVVSIEHKMGINASPTCAMEYDDATGYLVGEENAGMRYMFTMMNTARLSVGVQGLGIAEAAYQRARQHALERTQGRVVAPPEGSSGTIVDHADVRRMLLTMKSQIEALRGLAYLEAGAVDRAHHHPDEAERTSAQELVDLLTPIVKGWGTDLACEVTSTAVQVFGGMGYVEETGVAQLFRDARITPIYEGTNGIQAMDLVARKLPLRAGGVVGDFVSRMRATATELAGVEALAPIGARLTAALAVLEEATTWIAANGAADVNQALAAATPYLRLFSIVAGGWVLGFEALAAHRVAAAGTDPADTSFLAAKQATARFYADHVLSTAAGFLGTVTAGKDALFALTPDQL